MIEVRQQTYKVVTWGCQMNEEDSEQMELYLRELGYAPAEIYQEADIVLLNTCSVRRKPEDKAFSMLGRLEAIKVERPDMIIGVCGCMAQLRADEIRKRAPFIDFVIGTAHISSLPALMAEAKQKRRMQMRLSLPERKGLVVTDVPQRKVERNPKLRAFVPIQYGCDKFCTFCIVPTTRGRERSRTTEDILEEIRQLADFGTKEVTLLGQTVNSYGKNLLGGRVPFAKLLQLISEIPGIERIRFTSPYPRDFTDDLITQIAENPTVMESMHLPVQSGSDEVLGVMKRIYSIAQFEEIVGKLRDRVQGMSLTTDIIVGFPGETDSQFQQTLDLVEKLRFDAAFMFAYSPRPGTKAAGFDNQLPANVKRERLQMLIDLQNRITCEINEAETGREFEVLVERVSQKDKLRYTGNTRQNKTVNFAAGSELVGQIIKVRTTESHIWGFQGELVGAGELVHAR